MSDTASLRIDRWLYSARFYKTRQLAVKALKNGKISVNRHTVKPASSIRAGDLIELKNGPYQLTVEVLGLSDKRGSASVAQTLYQETAQSIVAREQTKRLLASQPKITMDRHKPDKRAIRSKRALKRGD